MKFSQHTTTRRAITFKKDKRNVRVLGLQPIKAVAQPLIRPKGYNQRKEGPKNTTYNILGELYLITKY